MRKALFCVLSVLFLSVYANAQTPADNLKKAQKAFKSYDPGNSKERSKIADVKVLVDDALKAPENQTFEGWFLKGKTYNEMAAADISNKQELTVLKKEKEFQVKYYGAAYEAYLALEQARKLATKKSDMKDLLEVLTTTQTYMNQGASDYYDKKDYANAYLSFRAAKDIHDILKANGKKSGLDDKEVYKKQLLYIAATASQSQKDAEAVPIYKEMIEIHADTGWIYESLFRATVDKNPEEAVKYLSTGMAKYPEDSHILISMINYKLKMGKLDELISDLKLAIQKEPKNTSLYVTLGNVYDQLAEQVKTTDAAKSKTYSDSALVFFNKTLEMDSKNSNAIYSIGASYYNKAAAITKELKVLDSDNSKEGIAKYEAKNKELIGFFDQALPYFEKAETIDPNDRNTLTALKEIFARKDKLDLSLEFKKRIENLDNNVKNNSYFASH